MTTFPAQEPDRQKRADDATTDGMPLPPSQNNKQPDLMISPKENAEAGDSKTPKQLDAESRAEAEALQYQKELEEARATLDQEQHQVPGIVDIAKVLLMYVETPEERVQRDRQLLKEANADASLNLPDPLPTMP